MRSSLSLAAILLLCGSFPPPAQAEQPADSGKKVTPDRESRPGRLFARGFTFENDQLKGMAIVSINPKTGAWKRLADDASSFAVSPDGQTFVFAKENALWNGDAAVNANPGKVFSHEGRVVFSPDSKSMLVTTWKKKPDVENEWEPEVWRMDSGGLSAAVAPEFAGYAVSDWSSDGQSVLAEKNRSIFVLRPDAREPRELLKRGEHLRFSPDGRRVIYVQSWKGAIRVVDTDGTNDREFHQGAHQTFLNMARFSPSGLHVAVVYQDLTVGADAVPILYADPKVTHPRIVILPVGEGEPRTLALPQQEGWDFYPTGELEWR